jgi:hypothetical protein
MRSAPLRDEAGMTLGLTIMVVVVLGVLGAGLLVLVQSQLAATAQSYGGQRALALADTGVQAAKRELLTAPHRSSYDGENVVGPRLESAWSYASPPAACGRLPQGSGICIDVEGDHVRVAVRYLPPPTAASGAGSRQDPTRAPEDPPGGASDYPDGRDFYLVEADGVSGDYRRKVRAILALEEEAPLESTLGEEGGPRVEVWSWRECRDEACL